MTRLDRIKKRQREISGTDPVSFYERDRRRLYARDDIAYLLTLADLLERARSIIRARALFHSHGIVDTKAAALAANIDAALDWLETQPAPEEPSE